MAQVDNFRRLSCESGSASLSRSRTWSEDIQKHWNLPVPTLETLDERLARYTEYFSLSSVQVRHVHESIMSEMELGLRNHAGSGAVSSLRMSDTCVSRLPTGDETGVEFTLDFNGSAVTASRVRLEGQGRVSCVELKKMIREESIPPLRKGLLDARCGAMELFDYIASAVGELLYKEGSHKSKTDLPLAVTVGFPCAQRHLKTAVLEQWTSGFETGRATSDPVEGLDMTTLLDVAFWRKELPLKVACVTNDATATLLACAYSKPSKLPPCTVAFLVGVGLNGAYVEPAAMAYGYKGQIINTEMGGMDKGLPLTDVDLEVDWADEGGHQKQAFEKMLSGVYLGEICRRLVVKIWQTEAPRLAWCRQSLPTAAAALIVCDETPELSLVENLLLGLWEWETDLQMRLSVQKIFALVFDRSAGLAACAIAALARKSERLQPAMGGVTVAVDGHLHTTHPWYSKAVRKYLRDILGETAHFIHLYVAPNGPSEGAAVLAQIANRQN